MIGPLRFFPFLRPMVWGGRRLEKLGKPLPGAGPYGESWELSDHATHRSVVANGPWAGKSLQELMEREADALLGPARSRYEAFPWLIKFLDARDWLSVQVHPDDNKAERLWPGEGGKTEAWFVLDAEPGGRIYAGLLPGVDEPRLRAALAAGNVADCLHAFAPQPGDCIFLPAGTVHAVGGGVLLAEVQQTSDATFRLFDWNRRDASGKARTLHIEEALACVDWTRGPVRPIPTPGFVEHGGPVPVRQRLVNCPFFQLEYLHVNAPFTCGGEERLEALILLSGSGRLATDYGEEKVTRGEVWLLPAHMSPQKVHPDAELKALLCTLP
jgi:mannose-6-phosphate isomerase